jgi:hypothetical protein
MGRKIRRPPVYRIPMASGVTAQYGDINYPGDEVGIVGAYANPETRQIFMQEYEPFTYAHEMFHILDSTVLTDADRRRFQKILGMPKRAWNTGTGMTGGGLRSPSEIGADYYAAVAVGLDPSRQYEGAYAQSYNPRRLRRFGRSLERLLARHPELRPYQAQR